MTRNTTSTLSRRSAYSQSFVVRMPNSRSSFKCYVLTRKIKEDDRFKGIPVIMLSSLSAESNQVMGEGMGADAYVAKFEPRELAATLMKMMSA